MFQNKYLVAMRQNNYRYVDAAVHVAVMSKYIYIYYWLREMSGL